MNKYEIIGIVGEGAYGIVYKAKCKETGEFGMFALLLFLLKSLASLLVYLSSLVIFITHLNSTFKTGFLNRRSEAFNFKLTSIVKLLVAEIVKITEEACNVKS